MLTTTILAAKCPKLVSPAMNTNMYENRIVQDNIKKLEHYGFEMIKPAEGYLHAETPVQENAGATDTFQLHNEDNSL